MSYPFSGDIPEVSVMYPTIQGQGAPHLCICLVIEHFPISKIQLDWLYSLDLLLTAGRWESTFMGRNFAKGALNLYCFWNASRETDVSKIHSSGEAGCDIISILFKSALLPDIKSLFFHARSASFWNLLSANSSLMMSISTSFNKPFNQPQVFQPFDIWSMKSPIRDGFLFSSTLQSL